jgi:hypothetical protein
VLSLKNIATIREAYSAKDWLSPSTGGAETKILIQLSKWTSSGHLT